MLEYRFEERGVVMKKSLGANTYLIPMPTIVVGTYGNQMKPNVMTAAWTGIVNSNPAMISVSLREATYTHDAIIKQKAFTVNIPIQKYLAEIDYIGTVSGRDVDKFAKTRLTAVKSSVVNAPYVDEFPIVLECKLVKYEKLGLHTIFIGEIKDTKVDEECLHKNHMINNEMISPIAYYPHGNREYYGLGEYLGRANSLWRASTFSNKIKTVDEKVIFDSLHEYYNLLDNNAAVSELLQFFDWEKLAITDENGDEINSIEEYSKWYKYIKDNMFNRHHIIEDIVIEKVDRENYNVTAKIHFKAETWQSGRAHSKTIIMKVQIDYTFKKYLINHQVKMKIGRYTVTTL